TGILQLVQQILVSVVVGLHRDRRARFVPGADVIAQALVGQSTVVMPLGAAFAGRDAVQGVQRLLIIAVADVVRSGAHLGAFLAGGIGLAAAAGGTVETKPEGAEAKPAEGDLLVSAAVLVLAAVSIGPAGSGPLLVPTLAAAL